MDCNSLRPISCIDWAVEKSATTSCRSTQILRTFALPRTAATAAVMGFICPCFVLDFVELAGHLFRSLCRSGSRRSAAIVPSGQEPLAPPDVFQHGALIQWQISKEGARDPALLLFGRGSRFGDEPLRPLADVRITPESGRVADIGGCRKRAKTGREQMQQRGCAEGRSYSITSSARASSICDTSRPSARAVGRLMTRSNLVGCWTGRSPGFAPRRILSTNSAVRRNRSGMLGP